MNTSSFRRLPQTQEYSGSAAGVAGNGTTDYYLDLKEYPFFSIEFLPDASASAAAEVALTLQSSMQASEPDLTARSYDSDVTYGYFGSESLSSGEGDSVDWLLEKDTPTPALSLRARVTVSGLLVGESATWTLRLHRIGR